MIRLGVSLVKALNRQHRWRWLSVDDYSNLIENGGVTLREADWLSQIGERVTHTETLGGSK